MRLDLYSQMFPIIAMFAPLHLGSYMTGESGNENIVFLQSVHVINQVMMEVKSDNRLRLLFLIRTRPYMQKYPSLHTKRRSKLCNIVWHTPAVLSTSSNILLWSWWTDWGTHAKRRAVQCKSFDNWGGAKGCCSCYPGARSFPRVKFQRLEKNF